MRSPDSITGFGDAQLGFVYGLTARRRSRPPTMPRTHRASRSTCWRNSSFRLANIATKAPVNIGANRWALRLGVPIVYAIGERMADPHLTTHRGHADGHFLCANDRPFRRDRTKQKPLFIFEGHLTHGFTRGFWGSIDLLWREGGPVDVDGISADNRKARFRSAPPALSLFRPTSRCASAPARSSRATNMARTDGCSAPSSAQFFKGEKTMATVLDKPEVSNALPPDKVKGRQSAMAYPRGRLFPG